MPAKSGVSGGIMAVIPGQVGIGVFSPPLDDHGNSVRGVTVCQEISRRFGLHVLQPPPRSRRGDPPRALAATRCARRGCGRPTSAGASTRRAADPPAGAAGGLFFGSVERLLRRVGEMAAEARFLVLDFRRVHAADAAAVGAPRTRLLPELERGRMHDPRQPPRRPTGRLRALLPRSIASTPRDGWRCIPSTDRALEWCEEAVLAATLPGRSDLTQVLAGAARRLQGAEPRGVPPPRGHRAGDALREGRGDPARGRPGAAVLRRRQGTVGDRWRWRASGARGSPRVGPGLTFGEMALLDGGRALGGRDRRRAA